VCMISVISANLLWEAFTVLFLRVICATNNTIAGRILLPPAENKCSEAAFKTGCRAPTIAFKLAFKYCKPFSSSVDATFTWMKRSHYS
jgi:hypothetical protein